MDADRKTELREAIARALWAHERDPIVDPLAYKDFAEIYNAGFFARADVVLGVVGPLLDRVDTLETALRDYAAAETSECERCHDTGVWFICQDTGVCEEDCLRTPCPDCGGSVVSSGEPT